ncbi:MAG: hypothetical protein ACFB20_06970 [Opitutales bacterium]
MFLALALWLAHASLTAEPTGDVTAPPVLPAGPVSPEANPPDEATTRDLTGESTVQPERNGSGIVRAGEDFLDGLQDQDYAFEQGEIEGLLENDLPPTEPKGSVSIEIEPSFQDALEEDFVRVPIRLRYGFTDNIEGFIGVSAFFANPQGEAQGNDVSAFLFGAKYRWHDRVNPFDTIDIATGVDVAISLRDEPVQVADGLHRVEPFIVFSRPSDWIPNLTYFLNLGFDIAIDDSGDEEAPASDNTDTSATLSPGMYYNWGRFVFAVRVDYENDTWAGGNTETIFIEPGLRYAIPRGATSWLFPGEWIAGISVRRGLLDASAETEYALTLEWDVNLSQIWRRLSGKPDEE